MFCEECGTKNQKGAAFCEKCGHKMPVEEKKVVAKEKKPMSKQQKTLFIVIAAVVAILVGGYLYLGSLTKPEKVALKYFKAYASNNADAIYDTLNVGDSKFVSKKILKQTLKDKEKISLDNYTVESVDVSDDSLTATVKIKAIVSGDTKTKTIKLTKSKNKKWLLFDNWTVSNKDLIVTNYSITVPKGAKVKVNNIELGSNYKNKEYTSSTYDKYVIPTILIGNYNITAELKSGIKLSGDMAVKMYGSFNSNSLKIDKDTEDGLKKDIKSKIKTLYEAAISNKDFDEIKSNFNEDYKDDIAYRYNSIKSAAQSTYNTLKEFEVTSVDVKSTSFSDDQVKLTLGIKYNYKVEYGSDKTEYSKKDASNNYVTVSYKLSGKDYIMTNVTGLPTYFSHYGY